MAASPAVVTVPHLSRRRGRPPKAAGPNVGELRDEAITAVSVCRAYHTDADERRSHDAEHDRLLALAKVAARERNAWDVVALIEMAERADAAEDACAARGDGRVVDVHRRTRRITTLLYGRRPS
jgi:hypothetical protein